MENEADRAKRKREEQRIIEIVTAFRSIRPSLSSQAAVGRDVLLEALMLLDDIERACLSYLRLPDARLHRHWAANLLLEALHEKRRIEHACREGPA